MYSFEKLDVWQNSREFTTSIYKATSAFPDCEKYGLVSQIRRSSISINSNLAEGSSRKTAKEQKRFYNIAYSSALELLNQLIISNDLQFLNNKKYKVLRNEIEKITFKINRLYKSIG